MADDPLAKRLDRANLVIARDDLMSRLPHLKHQFLLTDLPASSALGMRYRQLVTETVEQYDQSRALVPFLPRIFTPQGVFPIAWEKTRGTPVLLDPVDLASHGFVTGATGSGKSTFVKHLITQVGLHAPDVQQCLFDPQGEYQRLPAGDARYRVMHEQLPFCVTEPPAFMRASYYDQLVARTFADAFYGAAHTTRLWMDATTRLRRTKPEGHSLKDLRDTIADPVGKTVSFQERDARTSLVGRLDAIAAVTPGIYLAHPKHCITISDLCTNPVYWTMPSRMAAYEFLIALWVDVRLAYHRHHRDTRSRTLFVMDEGLTLWQADSKQHISGTPILDHAISQSRASGFGFLITSTSRREASTMVRSNANLQVTMRLVDGTEVDDARRTFRLNDHQAAYLHDTITRGECLIRLSHKYPEPLLCVFPHLDEPPMTRDDWQAALDRTSNLAAPQRAPITIATTEAPQAPPRIDERPAQHHAPPPAQQVALHIVDEQLLRYVVGRVITMTSTAYDAIGVQSSVGDKAKTRLLQLGLLTASRITVHDGQSGKASALQATNDGITRSGITSPRRSRGASAQGEWIIQELHRLLPGSNIEVDLGGKAPDLIFRIDPDAHDRFLKALQEHGHQFTNTVIPDKALVGIEVEVSDITKTVTNNLTKDRHAGLQHLVFAVLKKDVQRTVQHLLSTKEDLGGITVISALHLLDLLRSPEPTNSQPGLFS